MYQEGRLFWAASQKNPRQHPTAAYGSFHFFAIRENDYTHYYDWFSNGTTTKGSRALVVEGLVYNKYT